MNNFVKERNSLQCMAWRTLINEQHLNNPDASNEFTNVRHMLKFSSLGLNHLEKNAFEPEMKAALLTSKSMIENEVQIMHLRIRGTMRNPCYALGDVKNASTYNAAYVGPSKTAGVNIALHSVYSQNVTEIKIRIFDGILHPEEIKEFLLSACRKYGIKDPILYNDARCTFWFKRPNTNHGWKLSFYPDWKILRHHPRDMTRFYAYMEKVFDKICGFVTNEQNKFCKEDLLYSIMHQEKSLIHQWYTCPCGIDDFAHAITFDPVLQICTFFV